MSVIQTPSSRAQLATDVEDLNDGVYVVEDGELTHVADDQGRVDRAALQDAFDVFGINGRLDCQQFTGPRAQVVLRKRGIRTRTGPLPRKLANAIARSIEDADGVSVFTDGYFTADGHGRTTD